MSVTISVNFILYYIKKANHNSAAMSYNASIGSTTSTRVESSSKHIQACKVHHDLLLMMNGVPPDELHNNKMKYCMHKDEIVLSVSKPMFKEKCIVAQGNYAYPPVLTTLGGIPDAVKAFIFYLYQHARNPQDCEDLYKKFEDHSDVKRETMRAIDALPFFRVIGVSLGMAYASPTSGDTVASVMIGGLRTVRNGAFQTYCGDVLQWYWDGEEVMFNTDSAERGDNTHFTLEMARRGELLSTTNSLHGDAQARKRKHEESANGMWMASGRRSDTKVNTAYVKPYAPPTNGTGKFFDSARVFARALCDARPYDMVDIMICRQSL